jgi:hypothetical protein
MSVFPVLMRTHYFAIALYPLKPIQTVVEKLNLQLRGVRKFNLLDEVLEIVPVKEVSDIPCVRGSGRQPHQIQSAIL